MRERARRLVRSATTLQLLAYGAAGVTSLLTTVMTPAARGAGVASVTSGTVGAALVNLSLDTSLPATGTARWSRGWRIVAAAVLAASVAAAAGLGHLTHATNVAPFCGLVVTATALLNARRLVSGQVVRVQLASFLASLVTLVLFCLLLIGRTPTSVEYALCWLIGAALGVAVLAGRSAAPPVLAPLPPKEVRRTVWLTHLGICCNAWVLRGDQVFIAHLLGARSLGIYALSVAATEAAQAPGIVAAMREIRRRPDQSGGVDVRLVLLQTVALWGLVVGTLLVIGVLTPAYHRATFLSLALFPGIAAMSVARPIGARFARTGRVWISTATNVLLAVVSIPLYEVLISHYGMTGGAIASSSLYVAQLVFYVAAIKLRAPASDATWTGSGSTST